MMFLIQMRGLNTGSTTTTSTGIWICQINLQTIWPVKKLMIITIKTNKITAGQTSAGQTTITTANKPCFLLGERCGVVRKIE